MHQECCSCLSFLARALRSRNDALTACSSHSAMHAVCAQVRQTVLLAIKKEPQDEPRLYRCVAVETRMLRSML